MWRKIIKPGGVSLACLFMLAGLGPARAAESPKRLSLSQIRAQIETLKRDRERDRKIIETLEHKVEQIDNQNKQLRETRQKAATATTQKIKALEAKVAAVPSQSALSEALAGYWGQDRFVITGSAAVDFLYDRNRSTNTFLAQFEPLFLYQMNDWIMFEGEMEIELPDDAESEFNLENAQVHFFLNDYMDLTVGKFFLPFGDFIETLHPLWINGFVRHPLPYREEAGLLPFADVGAQLRGAVQWGREGQDFDYAVFVSNGPNFEENDLVGSSFEANNLSTKTNGVAYGGRFRIYPLPLSANLGRLELGASTYDGKWLGGLWFTSWGVNAAYHLGAGWIRAEYLETHRQMPAGMNADNRQGWYVEAAYQLSRLRLPFLGSQLNDYLHRTRLLVRYSGQNQRAIIEDQIPDVPGISGKGLSLEQTLPHAREVAFGLNYFITPSIVWKLEYDVEIPNAGGVIITAGGPEAAHAGTDRAILTQIAIGF